MALHHFPLAVNSPILLCAKKPNTRSYLICKRLRIIATTESNLYFFHVLKGKPARKGTSKYAISREALEQHVIRITDKA
jgi:hypothetical protein